MSNYNLPGYSDKSFENNYQRVVAGALQTAPRIPLLVKPRAKYRGWCWNVYAGSRK